MKKNKILMVCLVGGMLLTGCIVTPTKSCKPSECKLAKVDNSNLAIELEIEKNGDLLDKASVVSSGKGNVQFSTVFKDDKLQSVTLVFTGKNIRKTSCGAYAMDYSIFLRVPVLINKKQLSYHEIGSSSSIKLTSGKSICIYANKKFKVIMSVGKYCSPKKK